MSASQDKKLRKQQAGTGLDKKAAAAAKEEKERRRSNRNYIIGAIAVVLVIALAVVFSSSFPARHMTAVEINGEKYTVAQANFYYSYSYMTYYSNYYYYFYYGFGPFDTDTDLADQEYSEGYSWHDYFVDSSIDTMTQVQALCDAAEAEGFTMPEDEQAQYESDIESLETSWESNGYSSLQQFLNLQYGEGVTQELVETEMYRIYLASAYSTYLHDGYTYTNDELDSYYTEHADELDNIDYAYYTTTDTTVDADAICQAVNGTDLDNFNAVLAEQIPATDDTDAASATEITYTGENITSYYGETFGPWLLDASRVAGDTEVYTDADSGTTYIVMFISRDNNDYNTVSFRHILINAEATGDDGSYTDEDIAAAHDEAEALYEEWLAGDATEDSFAELANANSDDTGSNTTGGLYEDVYKGQMVDGINDWLFEDGRVTGDTAVIDNNGSYVGTHIVYFVGVNEDMTYAEVLADDEMRSADLEAKIEELTADYTATTHHLGMVGDNH